MTSPGYCTIRLSRSFPFSLRIWKKQAFSLVELLAVVALLSLMMGLSAPALIGSFRSSGITNAGNQLVDLVTLARQTAASKNVLTAVVFAPNIQDINGRAVGLMEYGPDRQWKTVGGWTILPESVYASNSAGQSVPSVTGTPQLKFRGTSFVPDNALIFYPDGRMHQAVTPTVKLRVVAATDAASASTAANYYDIVLNRDNSGYQIIRP